jgi:hypothetical protein
MDAALHADLRRAVVDRLLNPRLEVVLRHVVGVGRALSLPEPAERAADDADVGEVDVAVDDECRSLAGQLGPKLIGSGTHLLDHGRTRLGEQRRQLLLGQRLPSPPLRDRARGNVRVDNPLLAPPRALARDEAPELELHDVQDALLDPVGLEVLRVGAQPLGERIALRREALADLMGARESLLR